MEGKRRLEQRMTRKQERRKEERLKRSEGKERVAEVIDGGKRGRAKQEEEKWRSEQREVDSILVNNASVIG